MMNEHLNRYLDGEIEATELPADLQPEAQAWEAFFVDVRASGADEAPVGLESHILNSLREERRPPWARLADWWFSPRPVRVRPLIGLAAAAAIAALVFVPRGGVAPEATGGARTTLAGDEAAVYVQFVLDAPDATSVQVAGDFNGWTPDVSLSDPDGDGIWSGRARLSPGIHKYMFVLDGSTWVTDPNAERYTEDGFGNLNAVLALSPGGGAGAGALAP